MCNSRVKVRHLAWLGYVVFPALPATLSRFLLHTQDLRLSDLRLSDLWLSDLWLSAIHPLALLFMEGKQRGKGRRRL
jgi:hypothetical protein